MLKFFRLNFQNLRFGRIYLSLFQFWGRKRLTSLSIEYLTSFIGDWWVLVTVHKKKTITFLQPESERNIIKR